MHEYFYIRSKWSALEVTFPFLIIIPCEKESDYYLRLQNSLLVSTTCWHNTTEWIDEPIDNEGTLLIVLNVIVLGWVIKGREPEKFRSDISIKQGHRDLIIVTIH